MVRKEVAERPRSRSRTTKDMALPRTPRTVSVPIAVDEMGMSSVLPALSTFCVFWLVFAGVKQPGNFSLRKATKSATVVDYILSLTARLLEADSSSSFSEVDDGQRAHRECVDGEVEQRTRRRDRELGRRRVGVVEVFAVETTSGPVPGHHSERRCDDTNSIQIRTSSNSSSSSSFVYYRERNGQTDRQTKYWLVV